MELKANESNVPKEPLEKEGPQAQTEPETSTTAKEPLTPPVPEPAIDPLEEKTMEELKKVAKDKGFPNPDVFTTKKQVIGIIRHLETGYKEVDEFAGKSTEELQLIAKNLGFTDTTGFNQPQLIQIIKQLRAIKKIAIPEDTIKDDQAVDRIHASDSEKTKARLEKQPKMGIYLPLTGKETKGTAIKGKDKYGNDVWKLGGTCHPVTINGYCTWVPKGVMTEVPQQVYQLLVEAFKMEAEAGKEFAMSRSKDIEEALK